MILISGLLTTGKVECKSLRGGISCCIVVGKASVELLAITNITKRTNSEKNVRLVV